MKLRVSELRRIIRQVLLESYGGALGVDPTQLDTSSKGFYPYEAERGVDIQKFWYKSPARAQGSDGDPGRPSDASEYIGMKSKSSDAGEGEGQEQAAGEVLAT